MNQKDIRRGRVLVVFTARESSSDDAVMTETAFAPTANLQIHATHTCAHKHTHTTGVIIFVEAFFYQKKKAR